MVDSARSVASTHPMLYGDPNMVDMNGRTAVNGIHAVDNGMATANTTLRNGFSAVRQMSFAAMEAASNLPRMAAEKANVVRGL